MYLYITIVLKLLPDEGVEGVPVAFNQISPHCPQVAEHKRLTQHIVQLTGLLQKHTQKSTHTFKTAGYHLFSISSNLDDFGCLSLYLLHIEMIIILAIY